MKISEIKRTISQKIYTIFFVKDYDAEYKMHITFLATKIDGLEQSFSIYLKSNNADILELHNLLKAMGKYDKVEIKFIKDICGL